jgi:uncharacterized protein YciI
MISMKARLVVLTLALLALSAAPQAPVPSPKPPVFRKANAATIQAYIVLLRLRYDLYGRWKATGKWPDDPAANTALQEHTSYWQKQLQAGKALLAGGMKGDYWDNVALIVFEAASEAEANEIVANDPAVKAYVFQAQVRPFDLVSLSNKYAAGPP